LHDAISHVIGACVNKAVHMYDSSACVAVTACLRPTRPAWGRAYW